MLRKIILFFVAVLLAWHLAPILSDVALFGLISVAFVSMALAPTDGLDRSAEFYIQVVIWAVILWFIIGPVFRYMVGGVFPNAQRFTATKFVRRCQGVAWICIVIMTLVFIGSIGSLFHQGTWDRATTKAYIKNGLLLAEGSDLPNRYTKIYRDIHSYILFGVGSEREILAKMAIQVGVMMSVIKVENGIPYSTVVPPGTEPFALDQDSLILLVFKGEEQKALEKAREGLEEYNIPKIALTIWLYALRDNLLLLLSIATVLSLLFAGVGRSVVFKCISPILKFLDQGRMGFGGAGRFEGMIEEWRYLPENNSGGLFLGASMFNPFQRLYLKDDRHMLTIAGTRGGKGTTAIIPNLLEWKGSCVVIDPKGTNAAVTARRRRQMGQNVYVIDPMQVLPGRYMNSFNPLEGFNPRRGSIHRDIDFIVNALVVSDPTKKEDDHWSEGAKTVLRGFIAHMLTSPEFSHQASLSLIREFFSYGDEEKADLYASMSVNDGAGKIPMETAARIIDGLDTQEIKNILSNANAQTEWLRNSDIAATMSDDPTFSFQELKEKPTTVYLVLPPSDIKANKRFLRLFVNLVIRQIYQGGRSKTPVLMLMDEFPELGHMEEVVSAFSVAASYNLTLWPFVQSLSQLKKYYPKDMDTFLGNCRAVQAFSVDDPFTREYVSKELGTRSTTGALSMTTASNAIPLRDPSAVRLEVGTSTGLQYILRAGEHPLLIEKVPYYRKTLAERLNPGRRSNRYDPDPDFQGR